MKKSQRVSLAKAAPETLVVGPPSPSPRGMVAPAPTVVTYRSRRGGGWARRLARSWLVILVGTFVVLACLAFGALQGHLRTRIPYRVSAAGVDLGGLERPAADAALRRVVDERQLDTAVLQVPGGPLTVALSTLGIGIDVEATAARAELRGRLDALPLVHLWYGGGGAIVPQISFDAATFQKGLDELRPAVEQAPTDARLSLRGETIGVRPGKDGIAIDEVGLQRALVASAMSWRRYEGSIPTVVADPAVSTAAAHEAAGQANVYLSGPLRLRYRSRVIELTPTEIAGMLSVNEGADSGAYPLTFDNPVARRVLHQRFRFAETPAVNARVVLQGKEVVIKASKEGFGLDMPRLLSDLDDAATHTGLRDVVVPLTVLRPTRTTEQLQELGLSGLGSEFSTYYDPQNRSRATNIEQAAKLVDGKTIPPGTVFSLNAVMGPRTTDRGFDYAPVIVDGVLRQGVGGGICQFATTLFNAAFFAGLPIVEREAHYFFIDHYPIGRDATVAWGSTDLKFLNDTSHALMVRCWAIKGQLTVVLIGDTGRTVDYTTSAFYDLHPSPYSKSHPRVVYDDDLARGVVSWEKGYDGRSVRVVRTVTDGGRVLSRDTFVSTYVAKDWIKRIGTR